MTPRATIHVRSADSGDAISVIEVRPDASFEGPPLHHHDFDETFYVLDGELTFRLGDDVFTRRAGRRRSHRGVPATRWRICPVHRPATC